MKFHFYTKDFKLDYPEIGWIPPVESEPWSQWDVFHKGEYPELILFQRNGNWTLYVSALDSGRKDYVGRVNRLSWTITGNVHEDDGSKLFDFLRRVVPSLGNNDVMLQSSYIELLSSQIHKGDPEKWSHESLTEKQRIANELGKTILGSTSSGYVQWPESNDKWFGGNNNESRNVFLQSCFNLLTTEVTAGAAISLVKLGAERIKSDFSLSSGWDKLAVLLSDDVPVSPMPKPEETKEPEKSGANRYISGAIAAALVLLCWGIGTPIYNNHCNQRAIDQIEQSIKDGEVVNSNVLKRVETIEAKDVRAKKALDDYYISLIEKAVNEGKEKDDKALNRVLELAQTDSYASYVAGCYYYSNNDLKTAKEYFTKAAKGSIKDASDKLKEIDDKLKVE